MTAIHGTPKFGTRRLLKTLAIVAGGAALVAFVVLPIGRRTPFPPTASALVDFTPPNSSCSERPRTIQIEGRRVDAYEVVCADDPSTLAALPASEEPTTWSIPSLQAAAADTAVEEPSTTGGKPPVVVPRASAKPKPRPKAQRSPPPRSVAAATSVSQEKYGP